MERYRGLFEMRISIPVNDIKIGLATTVNRGEKIDY